MKPFRTLLVVLLCLPAFLAGCGESSPGGDGAVEGSSASGNRPTIEETGGSASGAAGGATGAKLPTLTIDASGGESVRVRVEIADGYLEQVMGLMYRKSLGENRGMLFVYEEEDERSFYMKNTSIPLSIAFMDAEGNIVDIQQMKPFDDEPPSYVSAEPAQYALEVNRGFFRERGVEVGDTVELPR
jgi:uncharacterized protein